ncbi:DUF3037 domain-containing protein [Paraburkholderia flagellata]|uniref:DUF3037 domain-containing protein n=1 Tax=Paraburkholderia flagellata TaxID=2883241 RepID=UPI001F431D51|nr:DUF3037 domain-containing protein [Paraburkholderia flagellata]
MTDRTAYSYAVLRYVHDIATGEFVNVGVVVMSAKAGFLKFALRSTAGRITDIFPDLKPNVFRRTLRIISKRCDDVARAWLTPLDLNQREPSLEKLLLTVLPKDDSALVWGSVGSGLSKDLEATSSALYERYVGKYDRRRYKSGRTDEDVWRAIRKSLEDRSVLGFFGEKTIHGKSDDLQFDLAWKNGVWHCIEPLSFDLSAPDSIRDKAHRCAGEVVGVSDTTEEFKVYFVVGKPSDLSLKAAYERALGILKNVPHVEVYAEEDKDFLFDRLTHQIKEHGDGPSVDHIRLHN